MAKSLPEEHIRILDFHRSKSGTDLVPDQLTVIVALDSDLGSKAETMMMQGEDVQFAGHEWRVSVHVEHSFQMVETVPTWIEEEWPELLPFHASTQARLDDLFIAKFITAA